MVLLLASQNGVDVASLGGVADVATRLADGAATRPAAPRPEHHYLRQRPLVDAKVAGP